MTIDERATGDGDLAERHAAQLPSLDDRWLPRPYPREQLLAGLHEGRVSGVVSHPLDNVRRHVASMNEGDPDKQFGLSALPGAVTDDLIVQLVGELAGVMPDPQATTGPVYVEPEAVLAACERAAERLARACERGESVVLATGHPVGLIHLYAEIGRSLAERGAKLARPGDGASWPKDDRPDDRPHPWQIRYLWGVALLTDTESPRHTHSGDPMERMLAEHRPDLVIADHGFAGAAIEAGVETVSVADVNDPALIVARHLGRTEHVIVMDDNVQPDAYWPCFQAIAARLP